MDEHGLEHLELEFLMDWFLDPGRRAARAPRRTTQAMLFDAAAALAPHHIKVGNIPGTPCELSQLTERYGELCAEAARAPRREGSSTSSCRST